METIRPGEDEALREALLELERARAREEQARAETAALLDALEAMTRAPDPAAAISALLARVAASFDAAAAAILRAEPDGTLRVAHATDPALVGAAWGEAARRIARPRRLIEIDHARLGAPEAARGYASLMSTPLASADGAPAAIACFSRQRAGFTADALRLLDRLGGLAAQALTAQALRERHALLAGVIEGSANPLAIFDAAAAGAPCIYVNPALERLTGRAADDLRGGSWADFLDATLAGPEAAARTRLDAAIAARRAESVELGCRRRDGAAYWARLTLFPVAGADGEARQVVATLADVTERRRAQAERDAARAQLDSALSSAKEGVAVLGPDGAIAYANAAFAAFYPAPDGWPAGADFATLWRDSRAAAGLTPCEPGEACRAWLAAGDVSCEDALPDGRAALVSATRTEDGGAVVTVADVTRLKRAEALLAERAAAIDAAQDGIALTDGEGRFRYMNPSHLAMFGFTEQAEIVGAAWDMLYDDEAADRLRREAFPALAEHGGWRGEAVGRRRDGTPVEQEISLTRIADGRLVCVTRDISERRRLERERVRLREEVQTAHRREAVGRIAAGVAHDFNNLLSAISGSAALARAALGTGDPALPHLDRIAKAAESGAELMSRLLGLGGRERRRVRLDLAGPLRDVADLVSAGCGPNVTVARSLPETPIFAEADPADILHLALNLAVNARDALGPEGGRVEIALRAATPADLARAPALGAVTPGRRYAVIAVADDGAGVPPEIAEDIFKAHVSTKGDAGTGLGLAIVAGVVADNAAALFLDSRPGEGARFEVLWPLERRVGPEAPARPPAGEGALAGRAVLIAEDSPQTLAILAAFLERGGAEVGPCDSALAAAEAIEDDPTAWDLLVTDLEMPELDGAALAARARAAAPALPILLCTGAPDALVKASSGRFDEVLRKPFTQAKLVAAARRALARPRE